MVVLCVAGRLLAGSALGEEEGGADGLLDGRRSQQQFISAVCWRPGTRVLLVANSQGAIKVMQLVGEGGSGCGASPLGA